MIIHHPGMPRSSFAADEAYRQAVFAEIRNAPTKEKAQEIALRLWHHMNATQEGFICPGCGNCAMIEDAASVPVPMPPES